MPILKPCFFCVHNANQDGRNKNFRASGIENLSHVERKMQVIEDEETITANNSVVGKPTMVLLHPFVLSVC